ncbi:MAG: glycine cleavage system aminomethyltransferase GcvT [Paracholeplasma sp.]|nr:glycine cleavage system aminomethyltransferase GcvT [Paracholeplasma sp.]MDY3196485.1 glycine cleavage system aminomethyltransferase GcvT [Paracholeplasma sp.]
MKKTPLYDLHLIYGAKMIEYANYLMPEQFSSIIKEHQAVRSEAGMFDCSHMGEFVVEGKDALKFLNYALSNQLNDLEIKKERYSLLLDSNGYILDDLMVYRLAENKYLLVVNASNIDKDFKQLNKLKEAFEVNLKNVSEAYGLIALQGPKAKDVLEALILGVGQLPFMSFDEFTYNNEVCLISRSGYTGEDGFEIYGGPQVIKSIYQRLYETSQVTPCGLGSRDTLRFEAGLPLYGHEINGFTTPIESRLDSFCGYDKDFIGKEALLKLKEEGITKRLIGIELLERNIAREGYMIYKDGLNVGYITTGYMIPGTSNVYANAYIDQQVKLGEVVEVQIRNKMVKAKLRNRKFYDKKYVRGEKKNG